MELPGGSTAARTALAIAQERDIGGGAIALGENHVAIRNSQWRLETPRDASGIFGSEYRISDTRKALFGNSRNCASSPSRGIVPEVHVLAAVQGFEHDVTFRFGLRSRAIAERPELAARIHRARR